VASPRLAYELRFALDPKRLSDLTSGERLQQLDAGAPVRRELHSIYYDTEDLSLRRRDFALRVRGDDAGWIQTLERAAVGPWGLCAREEYEARLSGAPPDLEAICDAAIRGRLRKSTGKRPLIAVFETRMLRTTQRLELDRTSCLLGIEVGEIRAGSAAQSICELGFELERGDPAALLEFAVELNASIGVRFESERKVDRGYALFGDERPRAQKASSIELERDASLGDAMLDSLRSCADQIVANLACSREGVDPEGVHQLRIGIRRLRAALGLFRDALPEHEWMNLRGELRWLASESGQVRDLDVFIEQFLVPAARFVADPKPLECLQAIAVSRRNALQQAFRKKLDSARFTRLVLVIGQCLQRCSANGIGRVAYRDSLSKPAAEFASRALAKRYAKAEERGAAAASGSMADRHALRIELKKLRYASEFLASLFRKKRGRRFIRELEGLQEVLGSLNDVRVARRLARSLGEAREASRAELERGATALDGWTAQLVSRAEPKLAKRWQHFAEVEPFWRD